LYRIINSLLLLVLFSIICLVILRCLSQDLFWATFT